MRTSSLMLHPGPLLWEVDFTALALGALVTLPSGLVVTRASIATVQTSASVVDATPAVDQARIGNDGSGQGLVFEEARTNEVPTSATNGYTAASATITSTTGPSGETTGRVDDASAVAFGSASGAIHTLGTSTVAYVGSSWVRDVAGSATVTLQLNWNNLSGGISSAYARPLAEGVNVWARRVKTGATSLGTAGSVACLPATSASSSIGTADFALLQCEKGAFATEAIITAGAAATRAGERLKHPSITTLLQRDGGLGLEIKLRPKGSSAQYANNMRAWTVDANNYVEIDKTTRAVSVVIGGVTRTLGTPIPTWNAGDTLELWVYGGGGTRLTTGAARVNGGATTQLGTGATQAALARSGSIDLLCNGTAAQFSAWVQRLRAYRLGRKPGWA